MNDSERFQSIKSKWEETNSQKEEYLSTHDETEFLLTLVEKLVREVKGVERARNLYKRMLDEERSKNKE